MKTVISVVIIITVINVLLWTSTWPFGTASAPVSAVEPKAVKATTTLRPLEELMPKMEARQTTNGAWRIWSMAYDATEWSECAIDLPTQEAALDAIADVRTELRITYGVGKAISEAFAP